MLRSTTPDKTIYINKAKSLISAIEKHIGFDTETGLVKDLFSTSRPNIDTFENLALCIAYRLDERRKGAKQLLTRIKKHIGYDTKTSLIKNKLGSENIFASDNLLLAIEYILQEEYEEARKQILRVETYIGFNERNNLLKNGIGRSEIYPFNSLLLAICYNLIGESLKADSVFNNVTDHVFFNSTINLIAGRAGRKNYESNDSFFAFDNGLLAICLLLFGKYNKSEEVIQAIEKRIGFHPSGLVKRSTYDDRLYTYVNSILAIAYQVLGGKLEKMIVPFLAS